ncbi:MAG: hypothetical protein ABI859_10235 [Pseudomonadota bacterium]
MTTTRAMNRREFAQVTGLLLPLLAVDCVVAYADDALLGAAAPGFAFYDPRFPQALKVALRFGSQRSLWRAIGSDVSAEWQHLLRPALSRNRLVATGITTPSVPFCLEILARDHAVVRMTQQRIDRDLIHWTLKAQAHG